MTSFRYSVNILKMHGITNSELPKILWQTKGVLPSTLRNSFRTMFHSESEENLPILSQSIRRKWVLLVLKKQHRKIRSHGSFSRCLEGEVISFKNFFKHVFVLPVSPNKFYFFANTDENFDLPEKIPLNKLSPRIPKISNNVSKSVEKHYSLKPHGDCESHCEIYSKTYFWVHSLLLVQK